MSFSPSNWYEPPSLPIPLTLIFVPKIKDLGLSFSSARSLRGRVELLPSGPKWLSRDVSIPGFATKDPVTLYYRDSVECMRFLLQNPIFAGRIHFSPERHYDILGKRTYGDWITSDGAWEMQVREMSFCKMLLTGIARTTYRLVQQFLAPLFRQTRPSYPQ